MADTVPGNNTTGATISVGGTVSGNLDFVGDHDWFKITLAAGQTYTITLTGTGAGGVPDTYLNIYDSTGANILASNDDIVTGTNTNSLINFTAPTTGTFYIDVGSFQDQYTGTYQLSVQPYVPPPVATNDQIADQLVNGYWGGDSHHFNVTQGGTITVNISTLNAGEQNLARAALAEWTDIIGVTFKEVTVGAQIDFDNSGTKLVASTSSNWSNGIISHSDVHISSSWVNNYGTSLYSYSFQSYVHEIGHALGLGHAGNYNNTATYPNDALFQNDSWATSIMSYFDQQENTYFGNQGFTVNYAVTPMVADILAMQTLYGLSTTTRTGDTTYGYNTNAGGIYDATQYPRAAYTIFDSGGTDTLDFSGSASAEVLNLNPETFSNVNGRTGNISIARGVVIENAIGGSSADTIIGNSVNNILKGNAGADILTGGLGNDSFLDTSAGHNGDTIIDFTAGDNLIFSDASLASFTFNLTGQTLFFSGGQMTLRNMPAGTMVASSASSGGVQLTFQPNDVANDFNGDGRSDFLLRDDSGWLTDWTGNANNNGGFANNGANTSIFFTVDWKVAGTADFNGDGKDDLLLRRDDGWLTDWLGNASGSFTNNGSNVSLFFSTNWSVVGTGDFNGDGRDDLLLRDNTGWLTDWLGTANGGFTNNGANASLFFTTDWKIAGTGDFNGDGRDDLLLRRDDGWVTEWLGTANGGFSNNGANVSQFFTTDWKIAGTGDFNGDGRDDILLRNDSGWMTDWLATPSGGFTNNGANFSSFLATDWSIASIGDFNGDKMDDVMLRNTNGWTTDWLGISNGNLTNNGAGFSAFIGTSWHVQDPFL